MCSGFDPQLCFRPRRTAAAEPAGPKACLPRILGFDCAAILGFAHAAADAAAGQRGEAGQRSLPGAMLTARNADDAQLRDHFGKKTLAALAA